MIANSAWLERRWKPHEKGKDSFLPAFLPAQIDKLVPSLAIIHHKKLRKKKWKGAGTTTTMLRPGEEKTDKESTRIQCQFVASPYALASCKTKHVNNCNWSENPQISHLNDMRWEQWSRHIWRGETAVQGPEEDSTQEKFRRVIPQVSVANEVCITTVTPDSFYFLLGWEDSWHLTASPFGLIIKILTLDGQWMFLWTRIVSKQRSVINPWSMPYIWQWNQAFHLHSILPP